jgi:methionyl-tRNA formyltransferase
MENWKYVFAGNRFFVLEKMLELNLPIVRIFALRDSFLSKELERRNLPYDIIPPKKEFVKILKTLGFDIFVSNGCPVILPITELSSGNNKLFINVHPSFLPDLRGSDPVPGALLYGRKSGATCYVMDDKIDTGAIIAQIPIEMTTDLECGLLYQLSFIAEKEVFSMAFQQSFRPIGAQISSSDNIYYTRKDSDLEINLREDIDSICRRIRAFNSRSQGAYFFHHGSKVVVRDCEIVNNPFLLRYFSNAVENEVVFNYEMKIVLKKGPVFLKLKQISADNISQIYPGDVLGA